MTSFQVRLSDEVHETVEKIAKSKDVSMADIIRKALEIYVIGLSYAEQGKTLMWEDPKSKVRAEVIIPGFTPHLKLVKKN